MIRLSKLINLLVPGTIPVKAIQEDMSDLRRKHFLMIENQELVVKAARSLGCVLVNIAAIDLVNGEVRQNELRPLMSFGRVNCCIVSYGK